MLLVLLLLVVVCVVMGGVVLVEMVVGALGAVSDLVLEVLLLVLVGCHGVAGAEAVWVNGGQRGRGRVSFGDWRQGVHLVVAAVVMWDYDLLLLLLMMLLMLLMLLILLMLLLVVLGSTSQRRTRSAPVFGGKPAVRAHVGALNREHDHIGRELDHIGLGGLEPHLAGLASILSPRRVALGRLAEEVLHSLSIAQPGGVDHEHGQGLQHDVEEQPVADALVGEVGRVGAARLAQFKVLEGVQEGEVQRVGVDIARLEQNELQLVWLDRLAVLGLLLGRQVMVVLVDGRHARQLGHIKGDRWQNGGR